MPTATATPHELQMFGCAAAEIKEAAAEYHDGPLSLAMSILSDAQEQMVRGRNEQARQAINRAKFLISLSREAQ